MNYLVQLAQIQLHLVQSQPSGQRHRNNRPGASALPEPMKHLPHRRFELNAKDYERPWASKG